MSNPFLSAVKSKYAATIPLILLLGFAAVISAQKLPTITKTQKISGEELKSLVKPTDKKPVLLNFWATWCGPCRSEFPELVQIDADYRQKGLNFYLVSVDKFGIIDTRVPEFLEQYESTMPSYLIDLPNRPQIAKAVRQIAQKFTDTYPLTLLFDANGKLVFQKIGRVDAKILRNEIDKVLLKTAKWNSKEFLFTEQIRSKHVCRISLKTIMQTYYSQNLKMNYANSFKKKFGKHLMLQ